MKKVLLIIDDDPVITAVYEKHFKNAGFEVRLAGDGETGLSAVREFRPDVVLLDLSMPKLNGVQWLKEVRGDARFASLPVVVFTAGTVGWQVLAANNSDVTFILSKERAAPREVVDAVTSALTTGDGKINAGNWHISQWGHSGKQT